MYAEIYGKVLDLATEYKIDIDLFRHKGRIPNLLLTLPRPIILNVGSNEDHLATFCDLPIMKGTKVHLGDGPNIEFYRNKYREIYFVSYLTMEEVASYYHGSDMFLHPGETITVSVLEAIIAGLPVASYPTHDLKRIVVEDVTGSLNENLLEAVRLALGLKTHIS